MNSTSFASDRPDPNQPSAQAQSGDLAPTHPDYGLIRSFVHRRSHITAGQQEALDLLMPKWAVPYRSTPLKFEQVFGRDAPTVLEIGFGMGETTEKIALSRPQDNFLGVEVFNSGVGAMLKRIEASQLQNVRIIQHDAVEVVRDMIAPDSLAGVHIYFPDPWPKKRHHKRRLVQPAFVQLLASRLQPGGYIHCATDWEHYAHQMLEVLGAEPLLKNTCQGFSPRPDFRPLTKFENRGLRLGHGVWDVIFERKNLDSEEPMNITLNGKPHALKQDRSVADLVRSLGYEGKRIAVERNGTIVPKSQHAQTLLNENDALEIVVAVGGG